MGNTTIHHTLHSLEIAQSHQSLHAHSCPLQAKNLLVPLDTSISHSMRQCTPVGEAHHSAAERVEHEAVHHAAVIVFLRDKVWLPGNTPTWTRRSAPPCRYGFGGDLAGYVTTYLGT